MWDNVGNSPVNMETMNGPKAKGGKTILNIEARNDAILLGRLREYTDFGNRATAEVVIDNLINRNIPLSEKVNDEESKTNTYLQIWSPKTHPSQNISEKCSMKSASVK